MCAMLRTLRIDGSSLMTTWCSPRAPRLIHGLLARHHHDPRKHKIATSRSHSSQQWNINHDYLAIRHRTLEEESSSSSDSSGIFSESCSWSTDGSHRDSSSIEDHIPWDWEHELNSNSPSWRNMHLNSSDSAMVGLGGAVCIQQCLYMIDIYVIPCYVDVYIRSFWKTLVFNNY